MAQMPDDHLVAISRTIQLAVAPVFLLTALGTILGVLSSRLFRVVDRVRVLNARLEERGGPADLIAAELALLARRRRLVNHAITSATSAALLVCFVIGVAFVGFTIHRDFSLVMAWLFVGAMIAFILALLCFLREVVLAVSSVDINPH